MVKAVIFDNDGVLVDSEPLHHVAEKRTLARYGVDLNEEEFSLNVGIGWHKMLCEWIKKFNLPVTPDELQKIHEQNLVNIFLEQVEPTPNVIQFIENLLEDGYRLGVASSSSRIVVDTGLKKSNMLRYFETIVCSEDVKRTKPDPEIYLLAARQLGAKPAECFVIEDSSTGIKAAKAAGMICAGYRNENSGEQNLTQADLIFEDFRDLKLPH
jgi:HAD superfamily hydrolase (TIGR01509 family)